MMGAVARKPARAKKTAAKKPAQKNGPEVSDLLPKRLREIADEYERGELGTVILIAVSKQGRQDFWTRMGFGEEAAAGIVGAYWQSITASLARKMFSRREGAS